MKKNIFLIIITLYTTILYGKNYNNYLCVVKEKDQVVKVEGYGNTENEALLNAETRAVRLVLGSFVTRKKEIDGITERIINDKIQEIITGTIKNTKIISKFDGKKITIECTISSSEILSFCKNNGIETTMDGKGMFNEISKNSNNKDGEIAALSNLESELKGILAKSFDFEIKVNDPQDNGDGTFNFTIEIMVYTNSNIKIIKDEIAKYFNGISIKESELKSMRRFGQNSYSLELNSNVGYYKREMSPNAKGRSAFGKLMKSAVNTLLETEYDRRQKQIWSRGRAKQDDSDLEEEPNIKNRNETYTLRTDPSTFRNSLNNYFETYLKSFVIKFEGSSQLSKYTINGMTKSNLIFQVAMPSYKSKDYRYGSSKLNNRLSVEKGSERQVQGTWLQGANCVITMPYESDVLVERFATTVVVKKEDIRYINKVVINPIN
jgi:predicted HicB family RNase H-like nuclease